MKRAALSLSPLVLALSGCMGFGHDVEPIYEIEPEAWVVVMPFKDPDYHGRWDSPVGHDLAKVTTDFLLANGEFYTRPYQDLLDLFNAETDLNALTPRDIAALCRADYVVVPDLIRWDPKDELGVGIVKATSKVRVRLFKVIRGRSEEVDEEEADRIEEQNEARRRAGLEMIAYDRGGRYVAEKEIEGSYPDTYLDQYGETFLDERDALVGLVGTTADKVAKLFYEYEEPHDIGEGMR